MITVQRTPLSYRVKVAPNGQILGTSTSLARYLHRFNHEVFDPRARRYVLQKQYLYYNKKTQTLSVPAYDYGTFIDFIRQQNIAYMVESVPLQTGLPVTIDLKDWVKDRHPRQTEAIHYLTTSTAPLRGLALNTGIGKTYCFIKASSILGVRTMLFCAGLVDQWKEAIFNFTTLREADVYVIQGAPSVAKLLTGIDRTLFPKIIICSLGTIRGYVTDQDAYENYPPFEEFFDRLKVGVKGIDEAHLNFHQTLMLDLRSNVAVNVAMTATFGRNETMVQKIYNAHYPPHIRHGEGIFDRYIDIYSYRYTFGGLLPPKAYMTQKGYNQSKYEEWLLRKAQPKLEYLWTTVYAPILHGHFLNIRDPKEKMLILCQTHMMCEWFKKRILVELRETNYAGLDVETYVFETSDEVLVKADIIISTPGSAGTGTDIKHLRTMLMTIATGSDTLNKQSLGRLRELPSGNTPIYCYTWCQEIDPHNQYQMTRRNIYSTRGKSYTEITL